MFSNSCWQSVDKSYKESKLSLSFSSQLPLKAIVHSCETDLVQRIQSENIHWARLQSLDDWSKQDCVLTQWFCPSFLKLWFIRKPKKKQDCTFTKCHQKLIK